MSFSGTWPPPAPFSASPVHCGCVRVRTQHKAARICKRQMSTGHTGTWQTPSLAKARVCTLAWTRVPSAQRYHSGPTNSRAHEIQRRARPLEHQHTHTHTHTHPTCRILVTVDRVSIGSFSFHLTLDIVPHIPSQFSSLLPNTSFSQSPDDCQ